MRGLDSEGVKVRGSLERREVYWLGRCEFEEECEGSGSLREESEGTKRRVVGVGYEAGKFGRSLGSR